MAALYVHVPFCFHKCHYCDFYSIVDDADTPDPPRRADNAAPGIARPRRDAVFVRRLIAELGHRARQIDLRPQTIFIGGGTPTLLAPHLWTALLGELIRLGVPVDAREFTVEANPETVTDELLAVLRNGGVNRLSLGAQSFHPGLLKALERWHEPASVAQALARARDAGIDNINLDLIFAIPGQTMDMLDADLDAALALEPTHLSCYSLIYEPNTAMTQRLKLGQIDPADEETERAMYERVIRRLAEAGFDHYEISNWARPGFQCEHNLHYWRNANWLGAGPSAASHVDGWRWKNQAHLGSYLATNGEPPITDVERLPHDQSIGEQLMLRLRMRRGADAAWLTEHLADDGERWRTIEGFVVQGLLERDAEGVRLTPEGLFLADGVMSRII